MRTTNVPAAGSGGSEAAAWLVDAAPRWFGTPAQSRAVLDAIRRREPKLAPTWLAAASARGDRPGREAEAEVAATRARERFFAGLAQRLAARFTGLRAIKGPAVARHYPPALVRYLGDLDAAVPDEKQVYEVGGLLLAEGWSRYGLTMRRVAGRRHVLLTLVRPAERPGEAVYAVQVGTLEAAGNLLGVRPWPRLPAGCPETRALLSVIAERTERRYELRDLLDAVVLLRALPGGEVRELGRLIGAAALAPEAGELRALLRRFAPGTPALPVPSAVAARLRRAAWVAAAGPAIGGRLVQHAVVHGHWPKVSGFVLARLAERTAARRALGAGWQLWGQPVEPALRAAIRARLPHDVHGTPVGDWLMSASPAAPPRIARALHAACGVGEPTAAGEQDASC